MPLSRFHFKFVAVVITVAVINLWTTTFLLDQISITTNLWSSASTKHNNVSTSSKQLVKSQGALRQQQQKKSKSPLYDQTLFYNYSVHRPWLDDDTISSTSNHPSYMLLLTNFGWNHKNQTGVGLRSRRFQLSTRLYEGIINHPYFHPTAWQDMNNDHMKILPQVRYYVFLDSETCHEKSWPKYGKRLQNLDTRGGRISSPDKSKELFVRQVLQSKLFASANAKYILFECGCAGPQKHFTHALKKFNQNHQMILASLSSSYLQAEENDNAIVGLVPPPTKTCIAKDVQQIIEQSCDDAFSYSQERSRPILWSFAGKPRTPTRQALIAQHDASQHILAGTNDSMLLQEYYSYIHDSDNYSKIARKTILPKWNISYSFQHLALMSNFAATAGGDCLFSYRFSEVISCGATPILPQNNEQKSSWLLPQVLEPYIVRSDDPTQVAREATGSTTTMCLKRQGLLQMYQKYIQTGEGVIRGIIDELEHRCIKD